MLQKIKNLINKKKNIIFIALDGVRLDFGREYPEIQNIINKGLLFSNMTAYAPHSIASFHTIFTGIYGSNNGVNSYFGTLKFKANRCKTITEYFKEQGYYCFGDTMNDLVIPKKGFDKLIEQEAFTEFIESHKEMVNEIKEKNDRGIPCFVHLHCSYAHNHIVAEFIKKYKENKEEFYKDKQRNINVYKQSLEKVNSYLKEIMGLIEKNNLYENSTIVFFSDHGTSVGEKEGERAYGTFCYDYSLKTFCLLVDKEIFPVKEVTKMIRNVDITPTILETKNIEQDKEFMEIDGTSLLEYTDNNKEPQPRIAFAETGGIDGPWPSPKEPNIHVIRTDTWKLIYNRTPNTFELYNLEQDPEETKNLIDQETSKFEGLKAILAQYIEF